MSGGIQSVTFGYNSTDDKYEATVTFNSPLGSDGHIYKLQALDKIQDVFGNALDGDSDGLPGGNFVLMFTINVAAGTVISTVPPNPVWTAPGVPPSTSTDTQVSNPVLGSQDSPAVASDAKGDYVVVWVIYGLDGGAGSDIVGQRYDQYGQTQGGEFLIDTYTGDAVTPAVAMDAAGDFVVVWAGAGNPDASGVYARVYDQFGKAEGDQFLVNQYQPSLQNEPSVAMDAKGDFVVTWTSYGQNGNYDGIYARLFNLQGAAQGGEFMVNTTVRARQDHSDVAMDQNGDFTVVWESYGQNGSLVERLRPAFQRRGRQAGRRVPDQPVHPRTSTSWPPRWPWTWPATSSSLGRATARTAAATAFTPGVTTPRERRKATSSWSTISSPPTGRWRPTWAWMPRATSSSPGRASDRTNRRIPASRWPATATTAFPAGCSMPTAPTTSTPTRRPAKSPPASGASTRRWTRMRLRR